VADDETGTGAAAAAGTPGGAAPGGAGVPGVPGTEGLAGPQLARAALDAALARRRVPPRRGAGGTGEGGSGRRLRGYSGPGPDPRDPQLFGTLLAKLVKTRGWQKPAAEAKVFGAWEKVVGAEVAAHSRPIKLEDGELTVEAESTAWATQLRLLAAKLIVRIAGEVGNGVVKKLHIHGPAAPSWSRGPRRVRGRGPRDTYG
jgi:predicted nucleic acid-binding Zn ribbon protein